MNKLFRRGLLFPSLLIALTILCLAGISGCHPGSEGEHEHSGISFNADTVRSHVISIGQARQFTASFRSAIDSFNKNCISFRDSMNFGHAEAFPSDVFYALLQESNEKQGKAVGIRIYYGRGANGEIKMVLVPYDKNGNDMIDKIVDIKPLPATGTQRTEALTTTQGQAVEDGQRCPTVCSTEGGLN